jgi:HSP20 family protein
MSQIVKFRPIPATNFFNNGFLDEFLNRGLNGFVGDDGVVSQPAVNVVETKDNFRLEVAVPGYAKGDFSLNIEKEYLTIEGKHESDTEQKDERYTRREFKFESFKRSYKLPETVNQEAISAVYENGILNVTLPKKEDVKPSVKTIQVG